MTLSEQSADLTREIFTDEFGTCWVLKDGCTAERAIHLVSTAEGPPSGELVADVVRGNVDLRQGEPCLNLKPDGVLEFWEVSRL